MERKQAIGELYARLASVRDGAALDPAELDGLVDDLRRLVPDDLLADHRIGWDHGFDLDFERQLELLPDSYGVHARDLRADASWRNLNLACGRVVLRGNPKFLLQTGPYSTWEELEAAWDQDMQTTALLFALGGLHDDALLIVRFLDGELIEHPPLGEPRMFRLRDSALQELGDHYTLVHGQPRVPLLEVAIWDFFLERPLPIAKWQVSPAGELRASLAGREFVTRTRERRYTVGEWTFPFGRCPVCKKVFFRPRRGKPRRYCSEACKVKGIPFASKRAEHVRNRRREIRNKEIAIARNVIASVPEAEQLDRLRKHFKGKKSRPQLLNLLRRAKRRDKSDTVQVGGK